MIIGISGKKGNGKDTVGEIINFLIYQSYFKEDEKVQKLSYIPNCTVPYTPNNFVVKKFADKLKDTVCLLTGCTREQLENEEFKNSKVGEDWVRYGYANGFNHQYRDGKEMATVMNNKTCSKERYEEELKVNWQTAYKYEYTYRDLFTVIGTDLFRNQLHSDAWVNATMKDYIPSRDKSHNEEVFELMVKGKSKVSTIYPNWIITDLRFVNEDRAIHDRDGITIRVNRPDFISEDGHRVTLQRENEHSSETALDNAVFTHTIDNDGTIEELIEKVKEILIKEKLL